MSISVSTVVTNVSTLLNDYKNVRWTVAELLQWGSEGQVELVLLKPDAYAKITTLQLVPGAKQTNPTGCITIIDVRQNADGKVATKCDMAALDRFAPNWMVSPTASTIKHWMDDPQPETFYVYPAQSSTPAKVVITHSAIPPALSAGGVLAIRDIYQARIEDYIMYRALSKDAENGHAERAVAYYQSFKQ